MIVVISLLVFGLIPAYIAHRKGRNLFVWWLAGALLWIVATPMTICLRSKKQVDQPRQVAKSIGWTVAGMLVAGVTIAGIDTLMLPTKQLDFVASKPQPPPTLVAMVEPQVTAIVQPATHLEPMPAASVPAMPPEEAAFIAVIHRSATAYRDGANDFVKGATRPARAHALCLLFHQSFRVRNWLGTVQQLSSSNDGHGVLILQVADQVAIGTTNNGFSDALGMHTLIDPGSPVFAKAAALHEGQAVSFSGRFAAKNDDCLEEDSITQEGAMSEPQFLFQFSNLDGQ